LNCAKKPTEEEVTTSKFLYVSSGACYSGTGNTTYRATTASNLVYRVNPSTGVRESILFDYNKANTGDSPVGLCVWVLEWHGRHTIPRRFFGRRWRV